MTIIKKFEPIEQNKRSPKKYMYLSAMVFFVLIIIEIWVSNNVVEYGEKLEKLTNLSKTLDTENQLLEMEIAMGGSLSRVASKSAELGFYLPESIQYIR